MRNILVPAGLLALGACSGGGGSGGGGSTPTPLPTLTVTLDRTSQAAEATDEVPAVLTFNANYTGTATGSVVPNVQLDSGLVLDGQIAASGTSYTVKLKSAPKLPLGEREGEATFRLCRDANCSEVYPGSTQKFAYTLTSRLADWTNVQRNSAHTGYVGATFDPTKFAKAWETREDIFSYLDAPLIVANDTIYISSVLNMPTSREVMVVALNLQDGKERWRRKWTANWPLIGAPVYSPSMDAVIVSGIEKEPFQQKTSVGRLYALRASDGQIIEERRFPTFERDLAATVVGDEVYVAAKDISADESGNTVYGYNLPALAPRWSAAFARDGLGQQRGMGSDGEYLYYYSNGMNALRRTDGKVVSHISMPPAGRLDSHPVFPMIGSRKSVISGNGSFGKLTSFDTEAGKVNWTSSGIYYPLPALANGVIYALNTDKDDALKGRIEAISEATGQVQWTLALESGTGRGNLIVTDNLLFVDQGDQMSAVSLAPPRTVVWEASVSGPMAISRDGKLIVLSASPGQGFRVTAFNLR